MPTSYHNDANFFKRLHLACRKLASCTVLRLLVLYSTARLITSNCFRGHQACLALYAFDEVQPFSDRIFHVRRGPDPTSPLLNLLGTFPSIQKFSAVWLLPPRKHRHTLHKTMSDVYLDISIRVDYEDNRTGMDVANRSGSLILFVTCWFTIAHAGNAPRLDPSMCL